MKELIEALIQEAEGIEAQRRYQRCIEEERRRREEQKRREEEEARRAAIQERERQRRLKEELERQRKQAEEMARWGLIFNCIMEDQRRREREEKDLKWHLRESRVNQMVVNAKRLYCLKLVPREEAVQFLDGWQGKGEGLKEIIGLSWEAIEAILTDPILFQRAKDIDLLNISEEERLKRIKNLKKLKPRLRVARFLHTLEQALKEAPEDAVSTYLKVCEEIRLTSDEQKILTTEPEFERQFSKLAPIIIQSVRSS